MVKDPLKDDLNRARQLKQEESTQRGIRLYDIDLAIAQHMDETIIPSIEEFDEKIVIPIIYGNPERWRSVRKDGFLRDKRGQIQIPLIMFKRNSIARNDNIGGTMNRNISYPSIAKFSKKHRYDRFSRMTQTQRPVEQYNITIPDYVTVTYEVMIWTDFIEHMNHIVEAFQYATDEYWGDKEKFKFKTQIDSFDNTTEVGEGSQRVVRTTFTMAVNAYLLPKEFDNEPTTKKSISPKKVVWGYETDLTGEKNFSFTDQSLFTGYESSLEFISTRNTKEAVFVDADTVKLTNSETVPIPSELRGSYDENKLFSVFVNGSSISPSNYTVSSDTSSVIFDFNTGSLGYSIQNSDEVIITGKFKTL